MAEWAKIGDFRTDGLGLDLYNLSIGAPKIKTSYINLPLESKVLDLSDVVTGRPSYGARTITLYLGKKDRSPRNWIKTATELASKIHGQRLPITLSIDPDYYYLGRIQCSSDKISFMRSTYEITATCDPYKYAQTESSFVRRGHDGSFKQWRRDRLADLYGIGGRHDGGDKWRRSIQHRAGGQGRKNPRIVAFARRE